MRPFERMRFEELPEVPRIPHAFAATRGVDLKMKSRPFGELSVHYREHGAGEPLLLVHGLMTTSYSWRYVYEPLGTQWRVIAPDLPGAGRSDKPHATYSAAALAEWLGEFQRELGIVGCRAIGNSLGGYLCLHQVMRDPGAYASLIDIHSPAAPELRYHALHAGLSLFGTTSLLRALVGKDGRRWTHRNVHYYDETLKSLEEAEEYAAPLRTREGVDAFARHLRETLAPAGFAELTRALRAKPFPIPLLLLYATSDPMVSPKNAGYLASLVPSAKLEMIEHTSHFMHVDTPEVVVGRARDFFG
jgi:pimeloyl-ACP methyl ester carboxylesterase